MLTETKGLRVGHATDRDGMTGCTVILCDPPMVAGASVRGSAPATREFELLKPGRLVEKIDAILLTGGSAFGIDAAAGVMRYLEERGAGVGYGGARVPIVVAAAIFDLGIGPASARPSAEMAYQACEHASAEAFEVGCVGAGTGATVGKLRGMPHATKSGIGSHTVSLPTGHVVSALAVVNCLGDVVEPETARILAGARTDADQWADSAKLVLSDAPPAVALGNTTLAVIATDVPLTRNEATRLADVSHDGIARAIRPAHCRSEGDVALALGPPRQAGSANLDMLCHAATVAVAGSIVNAVRAATTLGGVPAAGDRARSPEE